MTLIIQPPSGGKLTLANDYIPVDPDFGSVSLLLHGDGTNGSTTIIDSSPSPKTVTAFGDAQISTAQSKFGGSSLYMLQADADLFNFTNIGSSLEFPGDYTIECWVYLPTLTGVLDASLYVISNAFLGSFHALNIDASNFNLYLNSVGLFFAVAHNLSPATWHHIALCRAGSTVRIFTDGAQKGSTTSSSTHGFAAGSFGLCRIGGGAANAGARYIDDFRITKGVARYTTNFTPPTAPFPDIESR
jgi:hypothetical protein